MIVDENGMCTLSEEDCSYHSHTAKRTNADRIRSMTDEELAEWVWGAESAGRAYGPRGKKAWLDWLKQEVDDGNHSH
jgi:hypothetical protein